MIRFSLLALTFFFAFLIACTKTPSPGPSPIGGVVCQLETDLAGSFAGIIAQSLSCSNQAAIQSDLVGYLGKANLCAASMNQMKSAPPVDGKMKGIVGNIACPIAVNAVMGAAGQAVPSGWGCAPGAGTNSLSAALTATCVQLVKY